MENNNRNVYDEELIMSNTSSISGGGRGKKLKSLYKKTKKSSHKKTRKQIKTRRHRRRT